MMNKFSLFLCFVLVIAFASAQTPFTKVEPAFWWVGFNNPEVEVLFYHKDLNLSTYQPKVQSETVKLKRVTRTENPRYVFLTLQLTHATKAGMVPIVFSDGKKSISYSYELKERSKDKNRIQGFNSADVLYLIMPDRFANGDMKNDSLPGFYEGVHREKPFGRHGGDLKGISDHLHYIKDLGVTAIWLNPILENNQKRESYHGYAITDLYKVDQRFGSNDEYVALINKGHSMGIKMIQDMVINHIGNEHWLMKDMPEKDWVHQFPTFTRSNYRSEAVSDPYRSKHDLDLMSNGWFDNTMPDVNQSNPLFARYLIQNTLWWIEHAGIDGIRMDTYPYPDKDFMARWAKEILTEYPQFNIVGEVLMNAKPIISYWQQGAVNRDGYQSNLPSVIDFPLTNAINAALNEKGSWDTGLSRLYMTLSHDFIYPNANGNVTFVDNHDMSRYYYNMGRDMNKFKMGLTFLLTTRGIPQLYYGTELLMDGDYSIHPTVRRDVPGGWREDKENHFVREGRSKDQNEAYDFMKKLLDWRKTKSVIHTGKLMQFIPQDNVYVYFRYSETGETVMVVLNGNEKAIELKTDRFSEIMGNKTAATDIISGGRVTNLSVLQLPAQ
ncbi:MAG: glycoside hydrolase family 13 protein, partial [Flammeovirgaceae bacterium]